jgi:hypothetical protein
MWIDNWKIRAGRKRDGSSKHSSFYESKVTPHLGSEE